MNTTYSILQINDTTSRNNGKYAVIYPMQDRAYSTSRLVMPTWLPQGYSHMGIFPTHEEALVRVTNLTA